MLWNHISNCNSRISAVVRHRTQKYDIEKDSLQDVPEVGLWKAKHLEIH